MVINCVIGISTPFFRPLPFPSDSPNELSPMTDVHISGRPSLTNRRLLERLHARVGGVERGVKKRAEDSLARGGSDVECRCKQADISLRPR